MVLRAELGLREPVGLRPSHRTVLDQPADLAGAEAARLAPTRHVRRTADRSAGASPALVLRRPGARIARGGRARVLALAAVRARRRRLEPALARDLPGDLRAARIAPRVLL